MRLRHGSRTIAAPFIQRPVELALVRQVGP